MKRGDSLPVTVEGLVVGHAVVEEVAGSEATLFIPATRFIVSLNTSIAPRQPEGGKETIILED